MCGEGDGEGMEDFGGSGISGRIVVGMGPYESISSL